MYASALVIETNARTEREGAPGALWCEGGLTAARSIHRSGSMEKDLNASIQVGTRKMVNYARTGRSRRKLWWKSVAVLTCKSLA